MIGEFEIGFFIGSLISYGFIHWIYHRRERLREEFAKQKQEVKK